MLETTKIGRRARALAIAATLALAGSVRAGGVELGGELSFRVQSYRPRVDSEFSGGTGPYTLVFGSGKALGVRADYAATLSGLFGTAGLGAGIGYIGMEGKGLYQEASGGEWKTSGDSTALRLFPASLFVLYRMDGLATRAGIPVAPYARVSLERYLWIVSGTNHASKTGATNGYGLTLGVALLLDVLDPDLARQLSEETGVRHTCLTVDVSKARVNDFGSSRSWDLSTAEWAVSAGLTVTF